MKAWPRLIGYAMACAVVAAAACVPAARPESHSVTGFAQGTTYSLQWSGGATEEDLAAAVDAELDRIDALLSNYRPDSTLEAFNAARTTEPIELPAELVSLFELARRIHEASDGCFDPTVRPLVRAWGFDGDAPAVPAAAALESALANVGLGKLERLDATHARKSAAELEVDMSSIGQGYAVERMAEIVEEHGSTGYLAEIGGEIVARGTKPDGSAWRIGIENPATGAPSGPALRLPPDARTAVVTSGAYRHYFEARGRRFGHIVDPRTGWPVDHGLLSVTVVGRDAALAAAWGTALLCLGPQQAAAVADRENVAALFWISRAGEPPTPAPSAAFSAEWSDRLADTAAL